MRSKTFQQILIAVAPQNINALEIEATTASALASTYPENEAAFRDVESKALRQIFRIVVHDAGIGDRPVSLSSGEDRSVSVYRL